MLAGLVSPGSWIWPLSLLMLWWRQSNNSPAFGSRWGGSWSRKNWNEINTNKGYWYNCPIRFKILRYKGVDLHRKLNEETKTLRIKFTGSDWSSSSLHSFFFFNFDTPVVDAGKFFLDLLNFFHLKKTKPNVTFVATKFNKQNNVRQITIFNMVYLVRFSSVPSNETKKSVTKF